MKQQYNKLIRDNVPEIIAANGFAAVTRTVTDQQEFLALLGAKLVEEAGELAASGSITERADLAEVLRKFDEVRGFSEAQIEAARLEKREARGGFEKRIFLESTES